MSTQCIILAADILSSMDASYDPCEDFYLFASKSLRYRFTYSHDTQEQTTAGFKQTPSHPTKAPMVTLRMFNSRMRFVSAFTL